MKNDGNGNQDEPAPQGMSTPAIDPEKVADATAVVDGIVDEVTGGAAFNDDQVKAIKQFIVDMEKIRSEREALNDRKALAKEQLLNYCPLINFDALLIAYNVWFKAGEEQEAGETMETLSLALGDLSTVFAQPKLF